MVHARVIDSCPSFVASSEVLYLPYGFLHLVQPYLSIFVFVYLELLGFAQGVAFPQMTMLGTPGHGATTAVAPTISLVA